MTDTSSVRGLAKECWRRLGKWPQRFLTVVAVLVGVTWVVIGSLVVIAIADSPLHCPPTMGCAEHETKNCSSWGGFMQSATTRGSCDGSR